MSRSESQNPLRRSSRKRGPQSSPKDEGDDHHFLASVQLVDSSALRYACNGINDSSLFPSFSISPNHAFPILGFEVVGKTFRHPLLAKIYTMDACSLPNERLLIAAGGHGGYISVYGWGEMEMEVEDSYDAECSSHVQAPLMSWKGSRSWTSSVIFMESYPMLLISSSNDGIVVVWDIKKQQNSSSPSTWIPPTVSKSERFHSSGIFSMDNLDCSIATASKDSSLCISKISSAGELVADRLISGHHSGAIRGVCFGDEKDKLADCGADGRICVLDARLPEPCAVAIESGHFTGVNTVEWCRTNKFLLLTASKDPKLLLYDIRSYAKPFGEFAGHVELNTGTCRRIYRPSFVDGRKAVATGGEVSRKISLYSVEKGSLMSQGIIGYDANLVKSLESRGESDRIWVAGRQINQLRPLRHHIRR